MKAAAENRDARVDAYIESSADFARPILLQLRELVHQGCPEIQETIKWGSPSFEHHGMLCNVAAFKQHCVFGFWKHDLLLADSAAAGGKGLLETPPTRKDDAMGQFGRLTNVKDLPPKRIMLRLIRKAAALNESGAKPPRLSKPKGKLAVPKDLAAALRKNRTAAKTFEGFSYSKRKDYIEWLTEAKTTATRNRRLVTAIEWLAEGKSHNWKYESR